MHKIPTLFRRDTEDMRRVTREVHPDCQWVIDGHGLPTRKYDGTCVMFDGERWWARREVKPGKQPPPNYVPLETDPATDKTVGWEPVEQSAFAKFHAQALASHAAHFGPEDFEPGTYELIGVKVNGSPEQIDPEFGHQLMRHALAEPVAAVPRDFDGLAAFLPSFPGEGLVWHHPDGRMCKLKGRDFPKAAELWAVHVQGPDDILAAADRTDADRKASEINEVAEQIANRPDASPDDPRLHAVVVPWDGTAEEHAEALAEQQKAGVYTP